MHILVVEDDKLTASTIQFALRREGFSCDLASRGADAISLATTNNYEIIILDLMLPDLDGYEVLRRLRAAKVYTPVLILSGLTELDNRVQGLRIGADDFLTKPFDIGELIARLRAVVRRSVSEPEATRRIGKLLLNLDKRIAAVGDQPLPLTLKEYEVLEVLSRSEGRPVSRRALSDHLYQGKDERTFKVIDVFIHKVRKKLAAATGGEQYIETTWGSGYVLRDPNKAARQLKRA